MSPFHPSFLRNEDDASYIGNEFMVRRAAQEPLEKARVAARREQVDKAIRSRHEWCIGNSTWVARYIDTRLEYEDLPKPTSMAEIRCASHEHKVADCSSTETLEDIKTYIESGNLPARYTDDPTAARALTRKARRFAVHDDRLWKTSTKAIPRLVIFDKERRRKIIAEAHNDCGHRGRDPTY
ncbi:hypothetical protein FOMPIDRAFT_52352, partial [Fomitopsis schrenkii]